MLCGVGKCGGNTTSTSTTFRITFLIVNNLHTGTPLSETPLVGFFISLFTSTTSPSSTLSLRSDAFGWYPFFLCLPPYLNLPRQPERNSGLGDSEGQKACTEWSRRAGD